MVFMFVYTAKDTVKIQNQSFLLRTQKSLLYKFIFVYILCSEQLINIKIF